MRQQQFDFRFDTRQAFLDFYGLLRRHREVSANGGSNRGYDGSQFLGADAQLQTGEVVRICRHDSLLLNNPEKREETRQKSMLKNESHNRQYQKDFVFHSLFQEIPDERADACP